jgi:hypothetical protein
MLEFVLVLVVKMHSSVTNGADYLRHFFSTSFNVNRLLRVGIVASMGAPFLVVFRVALAVYWRSYLRG